MADRGAATRDLNAALKAELEAEMRAEDLAPDDLRRAALRRDARAKAEKDDKG